MYMIDIYVHTRFAYMYVQKLYLVEHRFLSHTFVMIPANLGALIEDEVVCACVSLYTITLRICNIRNMKGAV